MEELVSARLFFSFASGAGIVFGAVLAFFHSPSCCIIFFIVKALQEFFFLKSYIPRTPPSSFLKLKDQMVHSFTCS